MNTRQPLRPDDLLLLANLVFVPLSGRYAYMQDGWCKIIDLSVTRSRVVKLVDRGLIERARYGGGPFRPAWCYRITEAGRQVLLDQANQLCLFRKGHSFLDRRQDAEPAHPDYRNALASA